MYARAASMAISMTCRIDSSDASSSDMMRSTSETLRNEPWLTAPEATSLSSR